MTKLQRFLSLFGAVAFFGSTALATTRLFRTSPTPQAEETTPPTIEEQLLSQERGYLKVLEREPENKVALEALVMVRLQMNNLEGVVEPLETLIKVAPEESTYQTLYTQLQEQLQNTSSEPNESVPSSVDQSE